MKNNCSHGVKLPRGLVCDRGYLSIRLKTSKGPFFKGCGPHTKDLEQVATIALNKIRESQYLGTFGLPSKTGRIKFSEAVEIFFQKHFIEWRHPKTNKTRGTSATNNQSHLNALSSYFADFYLECITVKDLKNYRKKRLEYDDVAPGTINRDMSLLSSLFNMFEKWVAAGDLEPVALPLKNPCTLFPDLLEEPRDRVASIDELRRLKAACFELKDVGMWSIIETELHTSLRLNDLMKLEDVAVKDGQVEIIQGKTGTKITLPEIIKPKWAKVFVNFRTRWERVRMAANCPDLQFRDLRKTSLRFLEQQFTAEQIASKAGHSDSKITKKWYLKGNQAEVIAPMVEATKRILEDL